MLFNKIDNATYILIFKYGGLSVGLWPTPVLHVTKRQPCVHASTCNRSIHPPTYYKSTQFSSLHPNSSLLKRSVVGLRPPIAGLCPNFYTSKTINQLSYPPEQLSFSSLHPNSALFHRSVVGRQWWAEIGSDDLRGHGKSFLFQDIYSQVSYFDNKVKF